MINIHTDTISLEAYDVLAKNYPNLPDTNPWNAEYERPATISLLHNLENKKVLDIGCNTGWFTKYLLDNGSDVMALDVNENMVKMTKEKINNRCPVIQADINNGFDFIQNNTFDIVLASLVLDFIKNIDYAYLEINRVLKTNGEFVFSLPHPVFDYIGYKCENYMEIEPLDIELNFNGEKVKTQRYRRPISKLFQPLIDNGFLIETILEPEPTLKFKEVLPEKYEKMIKEPHFLIIKAKKIK
jgi:SAM-dependent methyltransferase